MIDANAFGEWIVAKAAKLGAHTSAENLRVAREAVGVALARDGDEIHVSCLLAGAPGSIRVDERMTRTAVGVLFPKVAHVHTAPLFVPRPEPRAATPPSDDFERVERQRREGLQQRKIILVVIAVIVAIIAGTTLTVAMHEHEREPSRGKREMHH